MSIFIINTMRNKRKSIKEIGFLTTKTFSVLNLNGENGFYAVLVIW
jgi:hypothetical protein